MTPDEKRKRIHNILYSTDSREELAQRIVALEELVRDMWGDGHPDKSCGDCEIMDECHEHMKNSHPFERCLFEIRIEERMRELRIEVEE